MPRIFGRRNYAGGVYPIPRIPGPLGPTGPTVVGPEGPTGSAGPQGVAGTQGPTGPSGTQGASGPTGPSSGASSKFASFFALMPGDNTAAIAAGAAVLFPQDGPSSSGISRSSSSQFVLAAIGTYRVFWQVSVSEAGQLMLDLDGVLVANSVAGRAEPTSQIMNQVFITTTVPNAVLRVINPPGNPAALTITPIAGGTHSVSAWLTIEQLS